MKNRRYGRLIVFSLCLLLLAAYFIPLPYYVSKPGSAMELDPIIDVKGGEEAKGSFMLTTIRMGQANIYNYALAQVLDYWSLYKESEVRGENETDEEYQMRQLYMMEGSKEKAIMSAFKAADQPYTVSYEGIYIFSVQQGMPAADVLKPADRIVRIDGNKIESSSQFKEYITDKQAGDTVKLDFIRDDKTFVEEVRLEKMKETGQPGIGIVLTDDIEVESDPAVEIDSSSIGGPSAGLMFALEIYNQLVEEDVTRGLKIAGTGTMDENGAVGPIGGIDQKVVAADKSGAVVFFAPNEGGKSGSNYEVAKRTAEDIGTDMDIVPVDTLQDALNYLKQMK
ncbi:MAG: SepM family pheromone-processing serine protease [Bacillus sp. (in: firmicutes)]